MEDLYYHISDIKNIDSIIEKGLLADEDGNIFLFINDSIEEPGIARNKQGKLCMGIKRRSVSDDIALNQLFLKEYALFEISAKGIEGKLKNDNVEELASVYHRIARQQQIKPEFIKLCGILLFGYIEDLMNSLKYITTLMPNDCTIYPDHDLEPTIGFEKKKNSYLLPSWYKKN